MKLDKGFFRQFYAALAVNMGAFSFGTIMAWTSTSFSSLEEDGTFILSPLDKSWISAIQNIGGLLCCFTAGTVMDKLGRKMASLLFTFPLLTGWLLLIFAQNVVMLYISRFVLGYSAAYFMVLGPLFVCEIAAPKIRGFLSNIFQVLFTSGMLFSYAVGAYVEWRMLSIICAVIPVAIFLLILPIPESSRHLIHTRRMEEAVQSLCWYRGTDSIADVQTELNSILKDREDGPQKTTTSSCSPRLLSSAALKPLGLCIMMLLIEQLSGFGPIVSFSGDVFSAAGLGSDANLMAIIFGAFQVVAAIASCFLIDRVGRRPLLIVGQIFMSISLAVLAAYFFYLNTYQSIMMSKLIPVFCLVGYIVACNIGIGPISSTLVGEMLPQNVRGIGNSICNAVLRLSAFATLFIFQSVTEWIGTGNEVYCFGFFTGICVFGLLFIIFCIPETKEKTLEDIWAKESCKNTIP